MFEADGTVGGIAKTVEFEGYRFDLGGHRFYTKLEPVQRLWEEMLGDELLTRPRLSRIYYRGRFFNYPLRAADVFSGLGLIESVRCALSYFYWRRKLKNCQPRRLRGLGRRAASAAASTTPSSAPTPRRSGASPAPRSRPSGRRSGSRSSASCTRSWASFV